MAISIEIKKEHAHFFIGLGVLLLSGIFVAAFNSGGPASFVGHSPEEGGVPTGAVMHFNLSTCPAGWENATIAQGRYLVGLTAGGTLEATVGTALTNTENRATGAHAVTISDPNHAHSINVFSSLISASAGSACVQGVSQACDSSSAIGNTAFTGITASAGSIAGTNAPYAQYLICIKL